MEMSVVLAHTMAQFTFQSGPFYRHPYVNMGMKSCVFLQPFISPSSIIKEFKTVALCGWRTGKNILQLNNLLTPSKGLGISFISAISPPLE